MDGSYCSQSEKQESIVRESWGIGVLIGKEQNQVRSGEEQLADVAGNGVEQETQHAREYQESTGHHS